jgi:hypothetical protein
MISSQGEDVVENGMIERGTGMAAVNSVRLGSVPFPLANSGDSLLNSKGGQVVAFALDRPVSSQLDHSILLRKIPLTDTCIHFHLSMDVLQNIVVETIQAWYKRPCLKQRL